MNKMELIEELKVQDIKDKRVLDSILKIKREKFILKEKIKEAYENKPMEIGYGQTISQPYTVAFMIENLELKEGSKVLEIGSGSGYNAAIMSQIAKIIYSIEIIPELVEFAKSNLKKSKIKNVKIIQGDGSIGYKKEAPYDRIIVTAASPEIQEELLNQLNENGILIIPVGNLGSQEMIKIKKINGKIKKEILGEFTFVPLKGKYGHSKV